MDENTFLQLDLNDLSNMTDQELGATKVFSINSVNYNRDPEILQTLGELGFEIGAAIATEGASVVVGATGALYSGAMLDGS